MRSILCIRHAESLANAEGLWQGQYDSPLSEAGRRQARALAERLAGEGLERLATSDLARARETAAILGEALGLVPRLEPALRERDVGRWTGLPRAEVERRHPREVARVRAGDASVRPGGGESGERLRARVVEALRRLHAEAPERRLAVVTHMGVLRALVPGLAVENGGLFVLELERLEAATAPC